MYAKKKYRSFAQTNKAIAISRINKEKCQVCGGYLCTCQTIIQDFDAKGGLTYD